MSPSDFIMGKRLRLSHYYAVTQVADDRNYQTLKQPIESLTMCCIFPFRVGLSMHGNLMTQHTRGSVTCSIHNIGHTNGMHTPTNTDTHKYICMHHKDTSYS